jgi:hypothetical protein
MRAGHRFEIAIIAGSDEDAQRKAADIGMALGIMLIGPQSA